MAIIQFGESVEGYSVPVLNEREVRAAAGLLFLATFLSLMFIVFRGNFVPIKVVIPFFFADFLVRVFVSPRYAPTLVLGRLIVGRQTPEWVAAKPKRLAWILGVLLSGVMFVMMVWMNTYSPVTGIICLLCLVFLFFESAFGICLGCLFYPLVYREKPVLCPGEVCEPRARLRAQKATWPQVFLLLAAAALLVGGTVAFQGPLRAKPRPILGAP
ncbi:MAG: DUF4395 domain-containing protein [Acidobacteria bacterium]|nr:DUF4395 domain-containing protein [Acidobacteriota bacterium]